MNIRKHQELLDFWEYSHNFDSEDGAVSIDEDITFDEAQQELQIELEHFNEMDLEQELHPIKDDDIQPEDEPPIRQRLKGSFVPLPWSDWRTVPVQFQILRKW